MAETVTVKEAMQNISNLLDMVDSTWFEDQRYAEISEAVTYYIVLNLSSDPFCIIAILLNALKKHLDRGKKSIPDLFM